MFATYFAALNACHIEHAGSQSDFNTCQASASNNYALCQTQFNTCLDSDYNAHPIGSPLKAVALLNKLNVTSAPIEITTFNGSTELNFDERKFSARDLSNELTSFGIWSAW